MSETAAIILAAGASSRLGQPKQLARLNLAERETLLERAMRLARAAELRPLLVVLGAHETVIRKAISWADEKVISNPMWAEGMASSLRAGIGSLPASAGGVIVLTCDMPALTEGHLRALVEAGGGGQTVASSYAGRRGVPAYFPRAAFDELLVLTGDAGARSLLVAAPALELLGGEFDVDTPEDLLASQRRFGS